MNEVKLLTSHALLRNLLCMKLMYDKVERIKIEPQAQIHTFYASINSDLLTCSSPKDQKGLRPSRQHNFFYASGASLASQIYRPSTA